MESDQSLTRPLRGERVGLAQTSEEDDVFERIRARLTYANVISTLCLFLLLGGGAYAAFSLPNDSVKSKHIVNGQVKVQDLAKPEDWHEVEPASDNTACAGGATGVFCSNPSYPWQNVDSVHASAAFYKDQLGVVHLKGLVRNPSPTTENLVFRLPEPYRPERVRVFGTVGGVGVAGGSATLSIAAGRVDVRPEGEVVFESDCSSGGTPDCSANGSDYVSLDGITFRPDG